MASRRRCPKWWAFGETLGRLHRAKLPPALGRALPRERYNPEWRQRCARALAQLEKDPPDAMAAEAAALVKPERERVLAAVRRAEELARIMSVRSLEFVPCHADPHPGNLLLGDGGELYLVDWDGPMLAPKERDLMFVGGSQGFMTHDAERGAALFYQGYGDQGCDAARPDSEALAYYRLERVVTDIAVDCERILSHTLSREDRAEALEIPKLYFLPGATLEAAFASDPQS